MLDRLFEQQALWFSVPALLGTAVFLVRVLLMFMGGDGDADFGDGGADLNDGGMEGHDSEGAFHVLSVQGIAAFLAGFGWGGVGAHLGLGWMQASSAGVGVAAGVAMVWLLGLLLKGVHDLQSSGTVTLDGALGLVGEVYVEIPPAGQGKGQVRLVMKNRMRIVDAISDDLPVSRSARVRVLSVNGDRSITVTPA